MLVKDGRCIGCWLKLVMDFIEANIWGCFASLLCQSLGAVFHASSCCLNNPTHNVSTVSSQSLFREFIDRCEANDFDTDPRVYDRMRYQQQHRSRVRLRVLLYHFHSSLRTIVCTDGITCDMQHPHCVQYMHNTHKSKHTKGHRQK